MLEGIIMKGIAGFYYVKSGETIYECKARGIFKKKKITPLVGDKVQINITCEEKNKGVIEKISKRSVELTRPQVANVDQVVIVFAVTQPEPNINLLDKLLVLSEYHGLDSILCFNKIDLDSESLIKKYIDIYGKTGYQVIVSSTYNNTGIQNVRDILKDKITVFAGPSGVGKSSLLNEIQEGLQLQTGELSQKIKRGKHTTRHTELIDLDFGGCVVDTPGFTSLDINFIELEELKEYFREFEEYEEQCKFKNCEHINEPVCGIKKAVAEGHISKSRYESYLYFIDAIKEHRRYKSW